MGESVESSTLISAKRNIPVEAFAPRSGRLAVAAAAAAFFGLGRGDKAQSESSFR